MIGPSQKRRIDSKWSVLDKRCKKSFLIPLRIKSSGQESLMMTSLWMSMFATVIVLEARTERFRQKIILSSYMTHTNK